MAMAMAMAIKDFFRTILTRVAGLGLEPQTIEAEAGKKRRGRRGRDRGRNPAVNNEKNVMANTVEFRSASRVVIRTFSLSLY